MSLRLIGHRRLLTLVLEYGKGTASWNPTQLFIAIQDQHGSKGRAEITGADDP